MGVDLQHVAERPVTVPSDSLSSRGLWSRAIDQLQAAICGLHGHDPLLHFEDGRMFLRCSSCGHETPGWDTGDHRPRPRFAGDAERHQLQSAAPHHDA